MHTGDLNMLAEEEAYHIQDSSTRGICLIINNDEFLPNTNLKRRCGSRKDAMDLSNTFENFLGFDVRLKENVTKKEFYEVLEELRELDHSQHSALVVALLSHGSRDIIYMSDGEAVPISCLEETFKATACHSLTGKPKFIIVQACQGNRRMPAVAMKGSSTSLQSMHRHETSTVQRDESVDPEEAEDQEQPDTIPDKTDFIFAYATAIGYLAYRDTEEGSWFIQQLCETLHHHAHHMHLADMLTVVVQKVSAISHHGEAELPEIRMLLRKHLYLYPMGHETPKHELVKQSSQLSFPSNLLFVAPSKSTLFMIDDEDDICKAVTSNEYWHNNASPRGYCIIIDNTDEWKGINEDGEVVQAAKTRCRQRHSQSEEVTRYTIQKSPTTMFLEEKFGQELGLHVQTYLGLTHKVLKCLLEVVRSLDQTDLECFVLIVLSKGRDKDVYDVNNTQMPIPSLLEYFSDKQCPSLTDKPKLFLFHTITTSPTPANVLNEETLTLCNDSLLIFSDEVEAPSHKHTTPLHSMLDLANKDMIHLNSFEDIDSLSEDVGSPLVVSTLQKEFNIYKISHISTPVLRETKVSELMMLLQVLQRNRENTILELKERQQKLQELTKKVRISRIVGSSVGCIGGCVAVLGLALVPVTVGGSLAITVAGGAVAAVGGLASFGASTTSIYASRKQSKKAENIISLEAQVSVMISRLEAQLKELIPKDCEKHQNPNESIVWSILRGGQGVARLAIFSSRGAGLGGVIGRVGLTGGLLAAKVGTTAARGVAIVGAAAAVVTIPIDSIELGYTAKQLKKGRKTKTEQWLQERIDLLEEAQRDTAKRLEDSRTAIHF